MKIIIPMAGWGSRLRPHTLTIPKPMVPIAGKPIVRRLVEKLADSVEDDIEVINFIIRKDFGKAVENDLQKIGEDLQTKVAISYQESPEGTAHAIYCAKDHLDGNVIVAFADTLFTADFKINPANDGVIWVSKVENPKAFGVVQLNENNVITDFIEKPQEFISDLAIIGIYYFKDGQRLKEEIEYLLTNDIREKGEYQLTNALENLKLKGAQFVPGTVNEWLDCGNKDACVYANQRVLEHMNEANQIKTKNNFTNVIIHEPCEISEGAILENAIIGPHVSIGKNTKISNSIVKNCIIQSETTINGVILEDAMIGNHAKLSNEAQKLSIGDYTNISNK